MGMKMQVKLEADYDRSMKESQSRDNITVRWDIALNRKRLAYFYFLKDDTDLRLMPGDELKLKHRNASNRGEWEGTGNIIRFDQTEEVCLELRESVSVCLQSTLTFLLLTFTALEMSVLHSIYLYLPALRSLKSVSSFSFFCSLFLRTALWATLWNLCGSQPHLTA
jgi:hypothetical protein